MVRFHRERKADVTVAALPVPLAEASAFGVIAADADGRIRDFQEKPAQPPPMPGRPGARLRLDGQLPVQHRRAGRGAAGGAASAASSDFGRHVLPRLLATPPGVRLRLLHQPRAGRAALRGAGLLARRRHHRRLLRRPPGHARPRAALRRCSIRSGRSTPATTRDRRPRSSSGSIENSILGGRHAGRTAPRSATPSSAAR